MWGVQRTITLSDKRLVAFQGERGAYSEDACYRYFGNGTETKPFPDFKSVFEAVEQDAVTHAVVPVENTQPVGDSEIEVIKAAAVGENVIQIGEDVAEGEEIVPAGHWLRTQDLGGLLALGIVEIPVARKPRVALVSTGDEVVPPDKRKLGTGQVRDINSYTMAAQTVLAGGEPLPDIR